MNAGRLQDKLTRREIWSLSNAFTSAFKQLEPIPQLYLFTASEDLNVAKLICWKNSL